MRCTCDRNSAVQVGRELTWRSITELNSSDPRTGETGAPVDAPQLRLFVMALFFIFGRITSLNDVIIPLPALCYAVIAYFGWYARRPA